MPNHDHAIATLDTFNIELPSWGFADTGTRFGKFHQPAAASTTDEKLHDAGLVHRLTGCCPTVALHVLWDFKPGQKPEEVARLAESNGVKIGAINPNVFQDQHYKFGSFSSPWKHARDASMKHSLDSVALMKGTGSKQLSMWMADGTNYPGQDNLRTRKHHMQSAFKHLHDAMVKDVPDGTLLIEYKPFEPAFYHTDIADWGMAAAFCNHAGKNAKVLVDTGHHLPGANIEHIVAFLLDEGLLGGFHFNDRKYADDDLTLGSIDPYAVFRIFHEIAQYEHDTGKTADIAYMVDQSHNLKPKIEAMVQTAVEAQTQWLRARLVDRDALAKFQAAGDITMAERCLKDAYETDVRPMLAEWRRNKGAPEDPLAELRRSGAIEKLSESREEARRERGDIAAGGGYA